MKQVFQRAQCCGLHRESTTCGGHKVRPVRRNERLTAVGQDQDELQSLVSTHRSKNGERFTFKGMARTNNGDSLGKVLMMGSVSRFPLIGSTTTN